MAKIRSLRRLSPDVMRRGDPAVIAGARSLGAIEHALRAERRSGRAGHGSYDLNRHLILARALKLKREAASMPLGGGVGMRTEIGCFLVGMEIHGRDEGIMAEDHVDPLGIR